MLLYGPNIDNFKEVYQLLVNLKIASRINSLKNTKRIVLKKINYSGSRKVNYKLNNLGLKIINKNILEINKFI